MCLSQRGSYCEVSLASSRTQPPKAELSALYCQSSMPRSAHRLATDTIARARAMRSIASASESFR